MRLVLAAIFLLSLWSSETLACSCAPQPQDTREAVTKAFESASLVFLGRIESTETFRGAERNYDVDLEYQRVQFYVIDSWKGEKATRVYVESTLTCCLCGHHFPESGEFLIYAYGPDENGYYGTSICSRTRPAESAEEDIEVLNTLVAETVDSSGK